MESNNSYTVSISILTSTGREALFSLEESDVAGSEPGGVLFALGCHTRGRGTRPLRLHGAQSNGDTDTVQCGPNTMDLLGGFSCTGVVGTGEGSGISGRRREEGSPQVSPDIARLILRD